MEELQEGRQLFARSKTGPAGDRSGKIKYGILAWLVGLPLPIVIIALFLGGCDF